jgi:hypothetical protein
MAPVPFYSYPSLRATQRALISVAVAFFLLLTIASNLFAQTSGLPAVKPAEIITSLQKQNNALRALSATLKIGVRGPNTSLIQWTDGLLAWRKNPEFIYLKGYKPLVPIYFLLKSESGTFSFFLPRPYTVYRGKNEVLEQNVDIDLKIRPQDILAGLDFNNTGNESETEFNVSPNGFFELTLKRAGAIYRKVMTDPAGNPSKIVEYNEFGFPKIELTYEDWRVTNGVHFPYVIKIKRLLPRPASGNPELPSIILEFKEVRPNSPLDPRIFSNQFPKDVKQVELG